MFKGIYAGRKVLVTGHTGFKGSWLVFWLRKLGAEVCGIGLPMPGEYNHFALLNLKIRSEMCNICDLGRMSKVFDDFRPEIVFHLAAQPLVRLSYREPVDTFASNVMGTVHVLEACRKTPSVRAIVAISSDKCYENQEWYWGYRETDPMGGYDPYSASKGCTELVISSYRRSFFNNADFGSRHHTLLASGRAGNVIGGGDWAADRLVPDIMKAAAENRIAAIRNPEAIRPWQHVLEPLSGYLQLGQRLYDGDINAAEGWNFGPADSNIITVKCASSALAKGWDKIQIKYDPPKQTPHEATLLRLDCSKAHYKLAWRATWSAFETFDHTTRWYYDFYNYKKLNTAQDLETYIESAEKENLEWTK